MRPHKSYWPIVRQLVAGDCVSAMAHVTGGGITENLPRVLPRGTAAVIDFGSWPVLPIFEHLQSWERPARRNAPHVQHGNWHAAGCPCQKI